MNTQNDISNDEKIYILELQYYLRIIEQDRHEYSDVPVDGFFGPQTAQAVRRFQQEAGLPETGDVDRETWDAIYAAYTALHTPLQAFPLLCIGRDGSVNLRPEINRTAYTFCSLCCRRCTAATATCRRWTHRTVCTAKTRRRLCVLYRSVPALRKPA